MSDSVTIQETDAPPFDALDAALATSGPAGMLALLARRLDEAGEYRALLDALLLRARHDLGLPLIQVGSLNDVGEPLRSRYEERYVAAIREVGGKFLARGDVPNAWPYFRAIGEPEPVARALDEYAPDEADDRLGPMIEVAFNQGANPRRGYALILKHYGTCSAVTAFEHLPREDSVRAACADALVRQVHEHLVANLRGEIAHRGQPLPREGTPIAGQLDGRDWLFAEEAYHVDVSHLGATVRVAPLLTDPAALALAVGLTDYGRRLSGRHVFEGEPPFENTYVDHGVYLRALIDPAAADAAVAHFRAKLTPEPAADGEPEDGVDPTPAQVLVGLLVRLNRLDEAIAVAAGHLADIPESALFCPSAAQLCHRAGRPDRLAQIARDQGDLVHYAAAALQTGGTRPRS